MNRLSISGYIAAALIIFCTAAYFGTRTARNHMVDLVEKAQAVHITDDSDEDKIKEIKPLLDDIRQKWDKYEPLVSLYSRHDEVERVTEEIEWLEPLYDNGYYTQINVKLVGVTEALDHLLQTETPSPANIF